MSSRKLLLFLRSQSTSAANTPRHLRIAFSSASSFSRLQEPSPYSSSPAPAISPPTSPPPVFFASRGFSSEPAGPSSIDYGSIMPEDQFHKLADDTIHDLLQKFEEYGDSIQLDGFDIDYGNHVLTMKLGSLGTYVINKQTPNRQIWLSSPVSGPARFDWDGASNVWVYRRTKANLSQLLEKEIEELCGTPIDLS